MQIQQYVLGPFATNCFRVTGDQAGACVLIDPADSGEALVHRLEADGLTPVAVLLTHGHYDHILAVPALQKRWPELPVYCHVLDRPAALVEYDMGQAFPTVSAFSNLLPLEDGQTIELMGIPFRVLHTPGHTPGSVCFIAGNCLFSGDTLFYRSIGRTDFEGGDVMQMAASLKKLAALPGDYDVLPGHEDLTRLSDERRLNPYLNGMPIDPTCNPL